MKYTRDRSSEKGYKTLGPRPAPPGVPQARWNKGEPAGRREGKELAWRRGHQSGLWDAVLTVRTEHPRVAEKLRKCLRMDEKGGFTL